MPANPPQSKAVSLEARVEVTINNSDVTERITNPVRGDEWRGQFYKIFTAAEVREHLAYNCLVNGAERVNQLEGWADLPDDAATMTVTDIEMSPFND